MSQTLAPGASAESLEAGRQIFLKKCNGCHDYPELTAYPPDEWRADIIPRMADKADLGADDAGLVRDFVLVARERAVENSAHGQ